MKLKTYTLNEKITIPESVKNLISTNNYCILDIETTGLSKKYHQVILIGILYTHHNQIRIEQFFAEELQDELSLLKTLSDKLRNFSSFITYNGTSFDLPFLRERFIHYNLEWNFNKINHVDILHYIRKYKQYLSLENCQLKTVEKFLGMDRKDTISGKDNVLLYKKYLETKSPAIENTILLHNYEDVYYLLKILTIFDFIPNNKMLSNKYDFIIRYMLKNINFEFLSNDILIKNNSLQLQGKTTEIQGIPDEIHYTQYIDFSWSPSKGTFYVKIPLRNKTLSNGKKCHYFDILTHKLPENDFIIKTLKNYIFNNQYIVIGIDSHIHTDIIPSLLHLLIQNIFINESRD